MKLYIKKDTLDCYEEILVKELDSQQMLYSVETAAYSHCLVQMIISREFDKYPENKYLFMAANQPKDMDKHPNVRLSIPVAAVYDSRLTYCGYIYPQPFDDTISLTYLTTYQRRPMSKSKRFAGKTEWHDKFERDEVGMKNRFKLLYNISKALHLIPSVYTPAYLTPEDIRITAKGKISIANLHHSQILATNKYFVPSQSITPDYATKSSKIAFANHKPIEKEDILFTYAVMFYQVLTGVHPYGGTILSAPYDKCVEIGQCIDNDLFAFGERSEYITLPENFNLHQTFNTLPVEIQGLFKRAFSSNPTARPTLDEWGKTLYDCITSMK